MTILEDLVKNKKRNQCGKKVRIGYINNNIEVFMVEEIIEKVCK